MAMTAIAVWLGWVEAAGPRMFAIGAVLANLLAVALHAGVERPIASFRDRVRGRRAATGASAAP